jgi:hypothetical protein
MTPGPRYRKSKPALWRGLCGTPLALRLSEYEGTSHLPETVSKHQD